jgi:exonuclease VII large subunit
VKRRLLVLAAGALLAATTADAHHSFAKTYAEEQHISLEGDVVSFEYRNPHTWLYFTARDATGVARRYGAEWANPRRLEQQGVGATSLKAGDHVIVTGAPSRSTTEYSVHLKSIRRPADGWSWPTGTGGRR